jgi:hypothetical protein
MMWNFGYIYSDNDITCCAGGRLRAILHAAHYDDIDHAVEALELVGKMSECFRGA